jgi:hypothetical protein
MWRLLHFVVIATLIGSAVYAYSVKYETIWYAEQIVKMKHKIDGEHDEIALQRAIWAHLTRPERIAQLLTTNLDTQPLALNQIVTLADLPDAPPKVDTIGEKLDALGLSVPTNTPHDKSAVSRTTPATRP